jgi:hypothetical protein
LQNQYIFADLNGRMWSLQEGPTNTFTRTKLLESGLTISSMGQDQSGELYVVDIGNGRVLKVAQQ